MSVMKQGKSGTAIKLKGVITLNPTKMIMKQGSKEERKALTSNNKSNRSITKPVKAKGK